MSFTLPSGPRANFNNLVSAGTLVVGQPYYITDEGRISLAIGTAAYADLARKAEIPTGTASSYNIGTSGGSVPLLNAANSWSAAQTFGDITAARSASTGVVYLGSSGSHYVYYDGSTYQMPNGALNIGNGGASFNGTISATNFSGSSSGTNTGDQTSVSGNAGTATLAYSLSNFIASNAGNPVSAPDTVAANVIGYVSNVSALGRSDGALYAQAYSSQYQHQIFGDYRTGQIAIRGKAYDVTGTSWTAWRTILDSSNFNSYAPTLTGAGASGTWAINVTGNASSASSLNGSATVVGNFLHTGGATFARFQNNVSGIVPGGAGIGIEIGYFSSAGFIQSCNRDTNAVAPMTLAASSLTIPATSAASLNSVGAITQNGAQVLHAGNYNSYAPTLGGAGASGTWAINITGNAGSATSATNVLSNLTFNSYQGQLVGQYDATQTRGLFAMGAAYTIPTAPSSGIYGNFYGLAYSYEPNYSSSGTNPQSKAGLGHQMLLMSAGVTQTAIGTGIWTNGGITISGGTSNFAGTTNFNGAVNINNQTLTASGSAVFSGGVTISNGLTTSGGIVSNTYITSNGPLTVSGLLTANNNISFSGVSAQVGNSSVVCGWYADSTNLAIRMPNVGGASLYIQAYNGGTSYATFGPSGSNYYVVLNATAGLSATTINASSDSVLQKVYTADLIARRSSTTGVLYLGSDLSTYIYNDGANINLIGKDTYVGGNLTVTRASSLNGSAIINNSTGRFQVNDAGNTGNGFWLYDYNTTTDSKYWRMYASGTSGQSTLVFDCMNDGASSASTWMSVTRSGQTPTSVNFVPAVTFNGTPTVNTDGIVFNGGSSGARVGYNCSTGVFLDGSNVGFRTYGNNGIYFQNGGGGTTWAWVNSNQFIFNVPISWPQGQWNNSNDGINRYLPHTDGNTYYNTQANSGTPSGRHVFRAAQQDRFYINGDGGITLVGTTIYFNNNGGYYLNNNGSSFGFSQQLSVNGSVTVNRSRLYLGGQGDDNHSVGNGIYSYNGSSDGESVNAWQFFSVNSKQNSSMTSIFVDGRTSNGGAVSPGGVGLFNISDPRTAVECGGTVQVTGLNGPNSYGQFQAVSGNRNVIFRNDGGTFYILFSDDAGSNSNARNASWNGYRPFVMGFDGSTKFNQEGGSDTYFGRNVYVNGYVQASSDRKLKTNIKIIENASDKLNRLNGVTFDWKSDGVSNAGLIAQELEEVAPELVEDVNDTDLEGNIIGSHKTANYQGFTAYLLEGWKAHEREISELKAQLAVLLANGGRIQ